MPVVKYKPAARKGGSRLRAAFWAVAAVLAAVVPVLASPYKGERYAYRQPSGVRVRHQDNK